MLTRTCSTCGRKNTTVRMLNPNEQHYVGMKCKYHWKVLGSLAAPVETNPFGSRVPGSGQLPYDQLVVQDGASNYWRLGEPSGLFIDVIGGLNGTASGTFQRNQPGKVSGNASIRFIDSASSGRIGLPSINLNIPFSMEVWMKTAYPITASRYNFIFSNRTGALPSNFIFDLDATTGRVEWGLPTIRSTNTLNDGQWHHLVGTCNGSQSQLFVDGILNIQGAAVIINTTGFAYIGWDNFGSFSNDSSLDEFAIYPKVLTPAQVLAHYNAGK